MQRSITTIETETTFSLLEICERGGVRTEFVIELVEYGVIVPIKGKSVNQWLFDALALTRLNRALRLQKDLELNLAGVAVSLDLLDEVDRLRRQVEGLDGQLKQLLDD